MLTYNIIQEKVNMMASKYPIKKVSYFGSYADGTQTPESDIDFLIEFLIPDVSLILLSDLKNKLEDELNTPVDIIHAPLPEGAFININKAVTVYGE